MENLLVLALALSKAFTNCFWPCFFVYGSWKLARLYRVTCPRSAEKVVSMEKAKSVLGRAA